MIIKIKSKSNKEKCNLFAVKVTKLEFPGKCYTDIDRKKFNALCALNTCM